MTLQRLVEFVRSAIRDRRGNVLMIFGLTLIPLTFATGMGIDYARAMRLQTKLSAAADAAALSAVSKVAMSGNSDTVTAALNARMLFMGQTQNMVGAGGLVINYLDPAQLTVTVNDTTSSSATKRTATVTYKAQSTNAFGGILGLTTLTIKGSSQSTASTAPNIDFYVMMDTSPSMLLPATTAGLNQMRALSGANNCAFACHQTNLVYSPSNTELVCDSNKRNCKDFYTVAIGAGIQLRSDLMNTAVQNLTSTATTMANTNNANYRMGIEDFDYMYRTIWPTTQMSGYWVDSDLGRVRTHVSDSVILSYCQNNYRVCGVNDNDIATRQSAAMQAVRAIIPTPGTGTNRAGDTPQNVLFVITDGMRDEVRPGGKPEVAFDTAACTAIKNQGTRIAILYTEYLPESIANLSWATDPNQGNVYNRLPMIEPALQSCASSGLYYKITTNDDISAALAQLFQTAVATAHIIQ